MPRRNTSKTTSSTTGASAGRAGRATGASAARPGTDGSLDPIAPPPATIVKTHRNRRLIALAVAIVAVCAALGAWAFQAASQTSNVVAVRNTIHAGQVISATDLGTVAVNTHSGLSTIPADQLSTLIGKRAQVDLAAGGLVPEGSIAATSVPGKGSSVVGIALKAGMAPASNITVGSPVRVVYLPAQGATSTTGLPNPVVGAVVNIGHSVDGTATNLDVLVPTNDAPAIQAAAASSRIAVVLDSKDR